MEQPKVLDLVRNMIRTKHYSTRTEEAYYPKKNRRLPVVFTKDEIRRIIDQLEEKGYIRSKARKKRSWP